MLGNDRFWLVVGLTLCASLLRLPDAWAWTQSVTDDGIPMAWHSSCVTWSLTEQSLDNSRFPGSPQPIVTFAEIQAATRASFETWDEVSCSYIDFFETEPSHCLDVGYHQHDGNANRIIFLTEWEDSAAPWREPEQIALTSVFHDVQTGEILDVDIEVNADDFQLTTIDTEPMTDIQNALTHEIGHMLGIGHSSLYEATMFESADVGEVYKRNLTEDDIEAVCTIYPLTEDPGHCYEPPGGLDLECETARSCNESDGYSTECIFDETVCCCELEGGYGHCSWTSAASCSNAGQQATLELDRRLECEGDRPDLHSTCCCTIESDGAHCDWIRDTECAALGGYPTAYTVTSEDLCGPFPRRTSCSCGAATPTRSSFSRRLAQLLSF